MPFDLMIATAAGPLRYSMRALAAVASLVSDPTAAVNTTFCCSSVGNGPTTSKPGALTTFIKNMNPSEGNVSSQAELTSAALEKIAQPQAGGSNVQTSAQVCDDRNVPDGADRCARRRSGVCRRRRRRRAWRRQHARLSPGGGAREQSSPDQTRTQAEAAQEAVAVRRSRLCAGLSRRLCDDL